MKKSVFIFLIIIIVLFISVGSIYFYVSSRNNEKSSNSVTEVNEGSQNTGTSEDLAEENSEVEHNLRLTIISPEGDTFQVRQARMYNALVEGNGKYSNLVKCHWEFFLNQNNKEELYKTMDNGGVLSGETKEMCGFTTTFIEAKGKLRVKLTLTVYDAVNDNLETISGEREYTVL